jgi:hypothetical protein
MSRRDPAHIHEMDVKDMKNMNEQCGMSPERLVRESVKETYHMVEQTHQTRPTKIFNHGRSCEHVAAYVYPCTRVMP